MAGIYLYICFEQNTTVNETQLLMKLNCRKSTHHSWSPLSDISLLIVNIYLPLVGGCYVYCVLIKLRKTPLQVRRVISRFISYLGYSDQLDCSIHRDNCSEIPVWAKPVWTVQARAWDGLQHQIKAWSQWSGEFCVNQSWESAPLWFCWQRHNMPQVRIVYTWYK